MNPRSMRLRLSSSVVRLWEEEEAKGFLPVFFRLRGNAVKVSNEHPRARESGIEARDVVPEQSFTSIVTRTITNEVPRRRIRINGD